MADGVGFLVLLIFYILRLYSYSSELHVRNGMAWVEVVAPVYTGSLREPDLVTLYVYAAIKI